MKRIKVWVVILILLTLMIGVVVAVYYGKNNVFNMVPTSNVVKASIEAKGVNRLGSLEFVLTYDPVLLKPTKVEKGVLANNAMMEFSIDIPGQVWVGIIDAQGMKGDGSLAVVNLQVLGEDDVNTPLTPKNIEAYDAETLLDIMTEVSSGRVMVKNRSLIAPIIDFGGE